MSYASNKVHHSQGNVRHVPFSWENKPGERKTAAIKDDDHHKGKLAEEDVLCRGGDDLIVMKLPPPPYENYNSNSQASFHDLKIPLPPCANFVIPPPSRSSSRRGIRKEDDPFLMAYKECTKSSRKGNGSLRKNMSLMSCKTSCSVRDDSIVRITHLPISKSQRERVNNRHE